MKDLLAHLIRLALLISGLILTIILVIGVYILWGYYEMNRDFANRAKRVVSPHVYEGSITREGHIGESTKSSCIKTRKTRLFWWVEIPGAKKRYLCVWQYGYSDFKQGEEVVLIHPGEDADSAGDNNGYLIARQDNMKDRASAIMVFGMEDMNAPKF